MKIPKIGRHIIYALIALAGAVMITGCGSSRKSGAGKQQSTVTGKRKPGPAAPHELAEALVAEARTWIGVPYVWGGTTRKGADCSGFLVTLYRDAAGIVLPRTTRQQRDSTVPLKRKDVAVGDILFFSSKKSGGKVAHVGMYVGEGRMIHSSSSRGVVEDDLSLKYYTEHYLGAGRVPMLAQAIPVKNTKPARPAAPANPVIPEATPKVPEISLDSLLAMAGPKPVEAPKPAPQPAKEAEVAKSADTAKKATADKPLEKVQLPVVTDSVPSVSVEQLVRDAFGKTTEK